MPVLGSLRESVQSEGTERLSAGWLSQGIVALSRYVIVSGWSNGFIPWAADIVTGAEAGLTGGIYTFLIGTSSVSGPGE
jgi:hypothetical protein